jgi:transposase
VREPDFEQPADRRPESALVPGPPGSGCRFGWLAPMVVWPLARPLIPMPATRPQGGGTRRGDDEVMFAALIYVLVSGSPWRSVPRNFEISWQNAHRRFGQWSDLGLWDALARTAALPGTSPDERFWTSVIVRAARSRLDGTDETAAPSPRPGGEASGGRGYRRPVIRLHPQESLPPRLFGSQHPATALETARDSDPS